MHCAPPRAVRITSLDDLKVFHLAVSAAHEISAILACQGLRNDRDLREQMASCSANIPANISEGFGQKTDRHCAYFQYVARGSCNEVRTHLAVAWGRRYITTSQKDALCDRYIVIGKMLTRWIQHLERENRPRRG